MTEINVDIDGGVAIVRPATAEVARRLIAAAAGRPVLTTTVGPTLGLAVAEEVAVEAGFVVAEVVAEEVADPSDAGGDVVPSNNGGDGAPQPPSKNATTAEWREFFDALGITYDSDATRGELIDAWERR